MDVRHLERLIKANAAVYAKKDNVDSDPFKPDFHLMPMAGSAGDPNGPIHAKGKYHMFYQHAPEMEWGKPVEELNEYHGSYSHTGWGHASSTGLVYWEHEPIAIMPERGSYDPNVCASGSAVIDDDGVPTIFYTAAEPQTQCIARSYDPNLRHWLKDKNNPILREPEYENYNKGGFRDPFLWREGTTWQMIVCGAILGVGGTALHFQSENLTDWDFIGPFCLGSDPHCLAWEVPNFLTYNDGKTGVLIVSPLYDNLQHTDHNPRNNVLYTIAPYGGNGDFTPGEFKKMDIAHPNDFYAALSMKAPDGRWITWGMNIGGSTQGHHWATHLSLPRVLDVRPDGLLSQEPIVELQGLRRKHWGAKNINLEGDYVLESESVTCEVIAEIELGSAKRIGLDMRASDDFEIRSRVYFDVEQKKFYVGKYDVDFELLEGEQVLRIHTLVDHGVMETFVNRRECGTLRPYNDLAHQAMRLFSEGGAACIRSVDVWEMGSIWERTEPMMDDAKYFWDFSDKKTKGNLPCHSRR